MVTVNIPQKMAWLFKDAAGNHVYLNKISLAKPQMPFFTAQQILYLNEACSLVENQSCIFVTRRISKD